jgi:hypothetical protein
LERRGSDAKDAGNNVPLAAVVKHGEEYEKHNLGRLVALLAAPDVPIGSDVRLDLRPQDLQLGGAEVGHQQEVLSILVQRGREEL